MLRVYRLASQFFSPDRLYEIGTVRRVCLCGYLLCINKLLLFRSADCVLRRRRRALHFIVFYRYVNYARQLNFIGPVKVTALTSNAFSGLVVLL